MASYLGLRSTNTTTSENVYNIRGYSWETVYSLFFVCGVFAQDIVLCELYLDLNNLEESLKYELSMGSGGSVPSGMLSLAMCHSPFGLASPPFRPSQSPNSIGALVLNVAGSA